MRVLAKGLVHTSMHFPRESQAIRLVCHLHRYIRIRMRILVALAPIMYRETLAHFIRTAPGMRCTSPIRRPSIGRRLGSVLT